MKVEFQTRQGLAEIYSNGLEYSLLQPNGDDKLVGLHPPVRCKDFFNDAYWSEATGKAMSIYGFKWTPGVKAISTDTQFMGIRFEKEKLEAFAKNLQNFLNAWEDVLGYPKSKVYADDTGSILVIEFSKEWTLQPIRVSTFTLFLRMGLDYDGRPLIDYCKHIADNGCKWGSNDASYVKRSMNRLERFISDRGIKIPQTYEQFTETSKIHHSSGIVQYVEPPLPKT